MPSNRLILCFPFLLLPSIFPALGSFQMSQLFASCGQSTGVSASTLVLQYTALRYSFSYLEPVCCSMSSSNCCFLTCIQVSQKAGQVIWYSLLFQNFPQFTVIHTVKGFGIVNKAEIDVFLELSCFFHDPEDVGNLLSGSSAFSKTNLNIREFMVHILLEPGLENFEHDFTSIGDECNCVVL